MISGSKRIVLVGFCIVLLFGLIFGIQYAIRQNRDTRSRASSTGLTASCGVSTAALVKPCDPNSSVNSTADVTWHYIQYVCTDDPAKTLNLIGDGTTCRAEADLRAEADQMCQRFCSRPTPTSGLVGGGIVPTVTTIGGGIVPTVTTIGGGGGVPVVSTAPGTIPNPTIKPTGITGGSSCPTRSLGDCDCNGKVQIASDFECWRKQVTGESMCDSADFNFDNKCSLSDFEIYRVHAFAGL